MAATTPVSGSSRDVTQITGTDVDGTIRTRCLWRLQPGQRWATPEASPAGRMADVYRSAGVEVDCPDPEAAPRRPTLQLVGGSAAGRDTATTERNGSPR